MPAQWTPMRWPGAWKNPAALDILKGTAIDYLLIGKGQEYAAVRERARQIGLHLAESDAAPPGVEIVKGEWPGVKMARGSDEVTGGPTGVPWVDSNGWAIRLALAFHPTADVWVDVAPAEKTVITADAYQVAVADSAAYGGRWIISLDHPLAESLMAGQAEALAIWKTMAATAGFFAARKEWAGYAPLAVMGVVSDFRGDNEFFSHELLNLLARAGAHYRILPKDGISAASFASLRAVTYTDAEPPSPALRKQVLEFVAGGGTLIAAPSWGAVEGRPLPVRADEIPRFSLSSVGNGKVALAKAAPDDPYMWAGATVVLVSHRYDLVRFWNGGATGSFCTVSPDGKQVIAHLLFYFSGGPDTATVQVAGRYRSVKASTVERPVLANVVVKQQPDAIEVHLPPVSQYVALQLQVST